MFNVKDTVQAQYANSPSMMALIDTFSQTMGADDLFEKFLSYVWSLETAEGFGLDIMGRIVDLSRQLENVPKIFPEEPGPRGPISMSDAQYRRALLIKAFSNIAEHSFVGINKSMRVMANKRGNAFAKPLRSMMILYTFYLGPEGYEYALMESGRVLVRPVGVGFDRYTMHPYFGFVEAESWNTFDQAPFAAY